MSHSLVKVDTPSAPKAIGPYSQAIQAGNFIFVSGQLPLDPSTGKLVESNILTQIRRVLDNITAILKASGSTFHHVVRADIFLKDLKDFAIVNEEYAKHINPVAPPARQTIQVAGLPLDALVEISCIAILP